METNFNPKYSSWLALRHVNYIYDSLLHRTNLSVPYVDVLKKPDSNNVDDFYGYQYTFKDIEGREFLRITSSREHGGTSVELNHGELNRTYSFNDVSIMEGKYHSMVDEIASFIDSDVNCSLNPEELFSGIKKLENPTYDQKIRLCLQRCVSFYALYRHYKGVDVLLYIGESFDYEDTGEFYGFSGEFNVRNKEHNEDNPRYHAFGVEANVLDSEYGYAFGAYWFYWEGKEINVEIGDIDFAKANDFDSVIFDEQTRIMADHSHSHIIGHRRNEPSPDFAGEFFTGKTSK